MASSSSSVAASTPSLQCEIVAAQIHAQLVARSPQQALVLAKEQVVSRLARIETALWEFEAYWIWLETHSPQAAQQLRAQYDSIGPALDSARDARSPLETKKASIASKWPGWDWKIPGGFDRTPRFYSGELLKTLVTLANLTQNRWEEPMEMLKDEIVLRQRSKGSNWSERALTSNDVRNIIAKVRTMKAGQEKQRLAATGSMTGTADSTGRPSFSTEPDDGTTESGFSIEQGRGLNGRDEDAAVSSSVLRFGDDTDRRSSGSQIRPPSARLQQQQPNFSGMAPPPPPAKRKRPSAGPTPSASKKQPQSLPPQAPSPPPPPPTTLPDLRAVLTTRKAYDESCVARARNEQDLAAAQTRLQQTLEAIRVIEDTAPEFW